jgi:hypothetical protein
MFVSQCLAEHLLHLYAFMAQTRKTLAFCHLPFLYNVPQNKKKHQGTYKVSVYDEDVM